MCCFKWQEPIWKKIKPLNMYYLWLLSLWLLPFFQGGYFHFEMFGFGLVQTFILMGLYRTKQNTKVNMRGRLNKSSLLWGAMVLSAGLAMLSRPDWYQGLVGVGKILVPMVTLLNLKYWLRVKPERVVLDLRRLYISSAVLMQVLVLILLPFFEEYFVQYQRVGGFFQYANSFGLYLYGGLVLLVMEPAKRKTAKRRGLIGILLVAGIFLTASRGVIGIGIISGLLFLGFNRKSLNWGKIGYGSLVLMLGIGAAYLYAETVISHVQVVRDMGADNMSQFWSRINYYEDGIRMIIHRPTGYGYLGYYFNQSIFQTGADYQVKFIHNALLQYILDYGLLAGLAYMALSLRFPFRLVRQRIKKDWLNRRFIVLSIGISGLFISSLVDFHMQFTVIIVMWVIFIELLEREQEVQSVLVKAQEQEQQVALVGKKQEVQVALAGKERKLSVFGRRITRNAVGVGLGIWGMIQVYMILVSGLNYSENYQLAYRICPTSYQAVAGLIKEDDKQQSVDLIADYLALNPNYVEGYRYLRNAYFEQQDYSKSYQYSKQVTIRDALSMADWDWHVRVMVAAIEAEQVATQDKQAYIKEILNLPKYMKKLEKERQNKYTIKHKANFELSQYIWENIKDISDLADDAM